MTTPLPMVAEAINAGGPVSIAWRNWLESVNRALNDGSLSVSALQALVTDLQAQVAALDAGSVRQGEGIALYGSLQDTLTIALRALDDSGAGALLAVTRDDFGRVSGTKPATITGTAGRVTVANGDAVAGLPTVDLATVADAGGGTLLRIVRDAWGRITGTSTPTTTDLAEGANLYHTTARARAAAVADTITDGVLDVAPSQNAVFDAVAGREPSIALGTTAQFRRGDKVWSDTLLGPLQLEAAIPTVNARSTDTSVASKSLFSFDIFGLYLGTYYAGATITPRTAVVWSGTDRSTFVQVRTIRSGTTALTEHSRFAADGAFQPGSDNAQTLGSASNRWSVVYAGTGTINTSDAREKTPVSALSAAEIAAAKAIAREIGSYQWLSSLAAKGAAARHHIGLTVQRCIEIMKEHGLDPMRYGFVCYDRWDESPEVIETWEAQDEVRDDDGNIVQPAREAGSQVVQPHRPAGDRYSFRMDQLCLFIAAGFEARLAALEAPT